MMDGLGARLVLCLGATSPCANVFTYGVLGITLMSFSRERTPFKHLKLASFAPLISAERTSCPKCRSSRKYFCYTCYIPVGISPDCLPTVKLPLPVDIIKHKLERVGKSTAAHACTLSPHSVNIHIYPDIPSYPDKSKVLLLYPSPVSTKQLPPTSTFTSLFATRMFHLLNLWSLDRSRIPMRVLPTALLQRRNVYREHCVNASLLLTQHGLKPNEYQKIRD
jgi:hypothetical protein